MHPRVLVAGGRFELGHCPCFHENAVLNGLLGAEDGHAAPSAHCLVVSPRRTGRMLVTVMALYIF